MSSSSSSNSASACAPERLEARAARRHELRAALGERDEHDAPVALRAHALDEAGRLEAVEHLRDGGRREVSGQRELAHGQLAAVAEAEEQAVLGEAELAGPVRLAPAQPPHRAPSRP